jgi:hypothetical protein
VGDRPPAPHFAALAPQKEVCLAESAV